MKAKLYRLFPLFSLLVAVNNVSAEQTVLLRVEGITEPSLMDNVRIHLSSLDSDEADGSDRYQYLVQQTIDKSLRAMGYYNSQYHFNLTPRSAPAKDLLIVNITLDQPVKLNETQVTITGEAENDPDFNYLLTKRPAKGTVLSHQTYENFKSEMEKYAQIKGYFDSHFIQQRLEVIPSQYQADWRLAFESGDRYHYGNIAFRDSQIREEYLRNILKIKSGDPYSSNDLSRLTSDYASSNWFTSVLVEPQIEAEKKIVDLNVLFLPRKKNSIEVGLGYETSVGPKIQFNWKKPWLNDRGHSIESNNSISKPEQKIEFGYKIPLKSNPLNYFYEFSAGLEREDQNDTKFTAVNAGFQRYWNHETGWAFSAGIRTRYDSFLQGNDKFKTLLVYPTASLNRTRSDGKRFPVWGDSQRITANWGTKLLGSDADFYSIKVSSSWIRTYARNHRIFTRAELGYLKAKDESPIPPALRFFAGGDRSIRGFGYKKVSPEDSQGQLIGGTHLATATLEYQYQVYPDWWGAVFYDTGLAANSYSRQNIYSGAGVGIRWASPIGAIKADIATPLKTDSRHKGIQFYIGLGSEL